MEKFLVQALFFLLPLVGSTASAAHAPVKILALTAGNDASCALQSDGLVACWGGMNPVDIKKETPFPLEGLSDADQIALGREGDFCVLRKNGQVACRVYDTLKPVADLPPATQIAMGLRHVCARLQTGRVMCWGENLYGQLGRNTAGKSSSQPIEVEGVEDVLEVVAGWDFSCGRKKDGSVWCWGGNYRGQMGNPKLPEYNNPPTLVKGVAKAVTLVAGLSHSCALIQGGRVRCWGYINEKRSEPLPVPSWQNVKQLALTNSAICALEKDHSVSCWNNGNLSIPKIGNVAQLVAGVSHLCYLDVRQQVHCWNEFMTTPKTSRVVSGFPVFPYEQYEKERIHPHIVLYRDILLSSLRSESAKEKVLSVDLRNTRGGDARELSRLARSYTTRKFYPHYIINEIKSFFKSPAQSEAQMSVSRRHLLQTSVLRDYDRWNLSKDGDASHETVMTAADWASTIIEMEGETGPGMNKPVDLLRELAETARHR